MSGRPPKSQPFNFGTIPELGDLQDLYKDAVKQGRKEDAKKINERMRQAVHKILGEIKVQGIATLPRGKVPKLGKTRRNRRNFRKTRRNRRT
jgi:hypothetical protein